MTVSFDTLSVGNFIQTRGNDWHAVMYKYGNERMVSAVGLGKRDGYPILLDEITDTASELPLVFTLQGDDILVWGDRNGNAFVSLPPQKDAEGNVLQGPRLTTLARLTDGSTIFANVTDFAFLYHVDGLALADRMPGTTDLEAVKAHAQRAALTSSGSRDLEGALHEVSAGDISAHLGAVVFSEDLDMGATIYVPSPSILHPIGD